MGEIGLSIQRVRAGSGRPLRRAFTTNGSGSGFQLKPIYETVYFAYNAMWRSAPTTDGPKPAAPRETVGAQPPH